eukprot:TRINITY_DN10492_c0_g1_i1.p1 TRINITY_DN10492_c0_g1~~TRINITY_DN10492_c0_g1_i1.p1  ORF type:complete len:246 (-),score=6.38 TRINITY_DN10492_c0_g1_i1:671-1408(-)
MVRVLNVAEKPTVAKEVAKILSSGKCRSRQGRSKYNHVFEFKYQMRGQDCDQIFTSVTGHIMELDVTPKYKPWNSCEPADLFDVPIEKTVRSDAMPIRQTLEQEARGCQWLVLWLDCDREGENIAFEVVEICKRANPRMEVFRAHFSSLVPREIHQACRTLTPPDVLASQAVDARQEIDLRIGAAFTRFQTLRLRAKFDGLDGQKISSDCVFGHASFRHLGLWSTGFMKLKTLSRKISGRLMSRL